jgi:hypothetical protein
MLEQGVVRLAGEVRERWSASAMAARGSCCSRSWGSDAALAIRVSDGEGSS